jgi:hypothetical protein
MIHHDTIEVMTPEEEHDERERGSELVRLTDRWGEWYRIWFECGMWWASRDGDKLSGDSPAALESLLCDHMALARERLPGATNHC